MISFVHSRGSKWFEIHFVIDNLPWIPPGCRLGACGGWTTWWVWFFFFLFILSVCWWRISDWNGSIDWFIVFCLQQLLWPDAGVGERSAACRGQVTIHSTMQIVQRMQMLTTYGSLTWYIHSLGSPQSPRQMSTIDQCRDPSPPGGVGSPSSTNSLGISSLSGIFHFGPFSWIA